MVKWSYVLIAVFAVNASPLLAQTAQPTPVSVSQQYDTKVVCKYEQNTGSRFATRICHTNQEWDQMREQHVRAAAEMQARNIQMDSLDPHKEN